jgi:hypothetical protein
VGHGEPRRFGPGRRVGRRGRCCGRAVAEGIGNRRPADPDGERNTRVVPRTHGPSRPGGGVRRAGADPPHVGVRSFAPGVPQGDCGRSRREEGGRRDDPQGLGEGSVRAARRAVVSHPAGRRRAAGPLGRSLRDDCTAGEPMGMAVVADEWPTTEGRGAPRPPRPEHRRPHDPPRPSDDGPARRGAAHPGILGRVPDHVVPRRLGPKGRAPAAQGDVRRLP